MEAAAAATENNSLPPFVAKRVVPARCPHCHNTGVASIWGLGLYCPTPKCPGPQVPLAPQAVKAAERWERFQRSQIQPVAIYSDGSGGGGSAGARKTGSKGKKPGPPSGSRPGSTAMLPALAARLTQAFEWRLGGGNKKSLSARAARHASSKGKAKRPSAAGGNRGRQQKGADE